VPSPYYYLISPVGTMHRAPTLPFPDQVEDRFVYFLGYNHIIILYLFLENYLNFINYGSSNFLLYFRIAFSKPSSITVFIASADSIAVSFILSSSLWLKLEST